MARIATVVLPGYPRHITQRGVRSMHIFHSKSDYEEYLRLLSEQKERSGLSFLVYCLMPNHVHLIAVPNQPESLAHGLAEAHRLNTRVVNFWQKVRGHLSPECFYSCPLDSRHLVAAVRYAERNLVPAILLLIRLLYFIEIFRMPLFFRLSRICRSCLHMSFQRNMSSTPIGERKSIELAGIKWISAYLRDETCAHCQTKSPKQKRFRKILMIWHTD